MVRTTSMIRFALGFHVFVELAMMENMQQIFGPERGNASLRLLP